MRLKRKWPRPFSHARIPCLHNVIMSFDHFIRSVIDKWPGKRTFGIYRFLPCFFALGATVEFSMIKWHVGEVNFYSVYKRKQAIRKALELEEASS